MYEEDALDPNHRSSGSAGIKTAHPVCPFTNTFFGIRCVILAHSAMALTNGACKSVESERAMPTYPALAFRSRFAAAAAIFDVDFLVVRAGVFLMASNIACFKF